jgi:methyltransferase (TIGR00027 family)
MQDDSSISNTAYYCCGVRMEDARRPEPICNDTYAERFMAGRGLELFEPFRSETLPNLSNVMRCKIIDVHLAAAIENSPDVTIVTVGAGFDSRPYRLGGGTWVELDQRAIMEYKEQKLPASECPNPLQRIVIDFSKDTLSAKLPALTGPVVVVIEGVFVYLTSDEIERTLAQLNASYPGHRLICDLMDRAFFQKRGQRMQVKLGNAGGQMLEPRDVPEAIFLQHGYRALSRTAMVQYAKDSGALWKIAKIPGFIGTLLLRVLMPDLNGYAIHEFASSSSTADPPTATPSP